MLHMFIKVFEIKILCNLIKYIVVIHVVIIFKYVNSMRHENFSHEAEVLY